LKFQREYRKLRNTREDFLDKASTAIAKRHDTIIKLSVYGMQKSHSGA